MDYTRPRYLHRQIHFPDQGNYFCGRNNEMGYPRLTSRNGSSGPAPAAFHRKRSTAPEKGKNRGFRRKNRFNKKHTDNITQAHTHTDTDRNRNSPEYKKFSALVRQVFNLLRSHHHLEKVALHSSAEPPTFSRITSYLAEVVKPAKITPLTKSLLEGNAKNWAYTTRLILIDHYKAHIEQETGRLQDVRAEDWTAALTVAAKWYRKRYPKKHSEGPIKNVEALLMALGGGAGGGGGAVPVATAAGQDVLFAGEDFPPLPRREGASSAGSSPWGPSPFPIALPPRSPRKRIRTPKINPVVAHLENHAELLQIQSCPDTQETGTPRLIHEPRTETSPMSPALVEVHVPNTTSPLSEEPEQGPQLELSGETEEAQVPETPGTPARDLCQPDEVLSPLDPLGMVPREEKEISSLPNSPLQPITIELDPPETFRPIRHISTNRKMADWNFSAHRPICLLGDSNLARITEHTYSELQIDSYPGGTFRHVESVLSRAAVHAKVRTVVLAFGINHRNQKGKETAIKQMQRAVRAAVEKFPGAAVWVPLVNFSKQLKLQEREQLSVLNAHIHKNMAHLPLLPDEHFKVTQDRIHWTPECAKAMLTHWAKRLNFPGL